MLTADYLFAGYSAPAGLSSIVAIVPVDWKETLASLGVIFEWLGKLRGFCCLGCARLRCCGRNCGTGSWFRYRVLYDGDNTVSGSGCGLEMERRGVLNGVDDVLHEIIGLVSASQLGVCFHLISKDVVVDLLVSRAFALQLILLFKVLVKRSVCDGFTPLTAAN